MLHLNHRWLVIFVKGPKWSTLSLRPLTLEEVHLSEDEKQCTYEPVSYIQYKEWYWIQLSISKVHTESFAWIPIMTTLMSPLEMTFSQTKSSSAHFSLSSHVRNGSCQSPSVIHKDSRSLQHNTGGRNGTAAKLSLQVQRPQMGGNILITVKS